MEAEERPSKKRRLTGDGDSDSPETGELVNQSIQGPDGFCSHEENGDPVTKEPGDENGDHEIADTTRLAKITENGLPLPNETALIADSSTGDQRELTMSKNQQKKLKKKLEWESKRDERKIIRKQKLVAKRERKRAAREQASENGDQAQLKQRQKSVSLPVTILIDCDFDDLMRDPERKSLAAQITRSYSDNKKAPFRSHLAVCSFGGQLRERFDNILNHYKSWRGVKFLDCDFVEAAEKAKEWMIDPQQGGQMAGVFSKYASSSDESDSPSKLQDEAEVVYLTSESENTLTELKPYSTYIIGGLVDKNREKGICYKRATKRWIKTARLPIGEFMDMQSRKVLATNHVNEIILRWLECGDWGEAFMKVIPKRKGGKLKHNANGAAANEGMDPEDEDGDEGDLDHVSDAGDEDLDGEVSNGHQETQELDTAPEKGDASAGAES